MRTGLSLRDLLRYPKGFLFLFLSLAVPLAVLGYLLLSESNESIRTVERELRGLAYIERLRGPLQHLQQHRGMMAAFGVGDENFRAMMREKQSIIDQGFYAVSAINHALGDAAIGARLEDLAHRWGTIKARAFTLSGSESLDAHNRLIGDLVDFFGQVVDASGLIQEPALDGFYLVDMVGIQLPRLTERIGQVRALGAKIAARGTISEDERLTLAIGLERLEERSRRLKHDLNSVFGARPDLKARLGGVAEEAAGDVTEFAALVREQLLETKPVSISAETVFTSGTQAIDKVFGMYDQVLPALDLLLRTRIHEYRQQRLVMVAVLVVSLLVFAYFLTTRNRLERLVEERTRELNAMNRELEAFSYSISHDLRTPLRAINGFSEVLGDELRHHLSEESKHCLERIRCSTVRMAELIDGLLALSQLLRSELTLEQVNLSKLARDIAARLQESEPGRRVEFDIADGLFAVGDARLLQALLENLFSNAWKFTGTKPAARIEFGRCADAGTSFYLRDNGVGFDMQFSHKLFEAFERLHDEREFSGNGIGLATVRRIVERHGGRVWAEGVLGAGATFFFSIGTTPSSFRSQTASLDASPNIGRLEWKEEKMG